MSSDDDRRTTRRAATPTRSEASAQETLGPRAAGFRSRFVVVRAARCCWRARQAHHARSGTCSPSRSRVVVTAGRGGRRRRHGALALYRNEKVSRVAHEVVGELAKVTWPTRKETQVSTIVVIVTSIIAAVIVGIVRRRLVRRHRPHLQGIEP